jgi:hypothetical protein
MAHSPCYGFPLLVPFSTYLAPSDCDRNRPPQSQVARKLNPFVPHCSPYTLPTKFPTLLGFPELNVHLIRATSQTLSPVYSTIPKQSFCNVWPSFCIIRSEFLYTLFVRHHFLTSGNYLNTAPCKKCILCTQKEEFNLFSKHDLTNQIISA